MSSVAARWFPPSELCHRHQCGKVREVHPHSCDGYPAGINLGVAAAHILANRINRTEWTTEIEPACRPPGKPAAGGAPTGGRSPCPPYSAEMDSPSLGIGRSGPKAFSANAPAC